MNPNLVWGLLLGACAAYEGWSIATQREANTLSQRLRSWFQVKNTWGKLAFTVAWLGLTAWFIPHIIFGGPK